MSLRVARRRPELAVLVVMLPFATVAGMAATQLGTRYGITKLVWFLAAGLAAVFVLRSPRLSFPLLFVAVAFKFSTKKLLGLDVHTSQAVELVIVLQLLAAMYARGLKPPTALAVPLGVMALGGLLGTVAGPDVGGSLLRLGTVLVPALLLALAAAALLRADRDLPGIVAAIAIALVGTGLLGFYQKAGGTIPGSTDYGQRIAGLFNHPNDLGDFVAVCVLLLTGVATQVWRRFRAGPVLLLAPIAVGLPTLAFTQSRGALMGLVVGLAVIVAFSLADRQLAPLLVLMVLAAVVVTVVVMSIPAQQTQEFLTRVSNTQLSITNNSEDFGRTAIYHVALQSISQHPFTGIGPLAFGKVMENNALAASFQGGAITAHNIYLEGYLSVGPFGLAAFLWICGGAGRRLWRARASRLGPSRSLTSGWALGSMAALGCMLVHGMVDFVFWQVELLMFYFAILGMAYGLEARAAVPADEPAVLGEPAWRGAPRAAASASLGQ